MPVDEERTVLFVAGTDEQARRLGTALADTRETVAVEWMSDPIEARDRLAWPDIDILVVVPSPGHYDALEFVSSIQAANPVLPVVYYGHSDVSAGGDDRTTFVTADGPDSVPTLADHVENRLDKRDQRRAAQDLNESEQAVEYPNVSEERLDELLEGGVDRQTLRELYHKAQLFDVILETLPAHLYVKDINGRHRYISEAYFGEEMDEFIDRADIEIGLVASNHAWRAFDEDMYVIEEGEALVDKEEYLPRLDQWNLTSKVPWNDEDGDTVGLIGVSREITRWKRREQELRRQNQRLASFSELVSHDLRNPLQVARSALTLAREDYDCEYLDRVAGAHRRMDEMIEDVLSLAKYGQTVGETEPCSLRELVAQAWGTVGDERGRLSVVDELGSVECDPNQIQRLLENLFRNALEHGGDEVTVTVEPISRPWPNHPEEAPRQGFAVADDGPGIPEGGRDRVLDPGYSTASDGTGFGLAIVKEIVDAHGWTIEVTESDDGGARFVILDIGRTDADDQLTDDEDGHDGDQSTDGGDELGKSAGAIEPEPED